MNTTQRNATVPSVKRKIQCQVRPGMQAVDTYVDHYFEAHNKEQMAVIRQWMPRAMRWKYKIVTLEKLLDLWKRTEIN